MIRVENIDTWGFEHAIRGMRNSFNSWDKSDSYENYTVEWAEDEECTEIWHPYYRVGAADLDLMNKLYIAGEKTTPSHRKYLRQIQVSMDITAPLYWWKEMDQYKIGTTSNSCSTMHKIHAKEFTLDDFSADHLKSGALITLDSLIERLNYWRLEYLKTKDKGDWWQMIQLLPSSYNQKRTVTMNYENVFNIIHQRSNHKLDEWVEFTNILKDLPFVKVIMDIDTDK